MKWIYIRSDYILQNYDIYNLTQRRCIRINYEFSNISIQISTLCNLKFHSHTSQRVRQLMIYLRNNKLLTLGFTVFIKHSMVCQPIKTFSIEQIKEAWKWNFLWQNVAIAANSQINDGFHLVTISQFACSDTIDTNSIYSTLNKACHFGGISNRLATVSFKKRHSPW